MSCGIYTIINTTNEKWYIGSSNNLEHRWNQHKHLLNKGTHPNAHLQCAYNKYGKDKFIFVTLEETSKEHLLQIEQQYLNWIKVMPKVWFYNMALDVSKTRLGLHPSEETRLKMSLSAIGRKASIETRLKLSKIHKGKKLNCIRKPVSIETRLKLSKSNTGKKRSVDFCLNMSKLHKGKTISDAARLNMSKAHKGQISHMLGKKHSIESKLKMSQSAKNRWQRQLLEIVTTI